MKSHKTSLRVLFTFTFWFLSKSFGSSSSFFDSVTSLSLLSHKKARHRLYHSYYFVKSRGIISFTIMNSTANDNSDGHDNGADDDWATVPTKKNRNRNKNNNFNNNYNYNPGRNQPSFVPVRVDFIPPTDTTLQFQPFMLLLCGLPGSGKSTFARALEQAMPYKFVRINQDELGNRKRCEAEARKVLAENKCPVIDRCNFDEAQRFKWFELVQQYEQQQGKKTQRPIPIDCIILQHTSMEDCIYRCETRSQHETITPETARHVVRLVAGQFSPPSRQEESTNNIQYRAVKTIPISDNNIFQDVLLEYLNRR